LNELDRQRRLPYRTSAKNDDLAVGHVVLLSKTTAEVTVAFEFLNDGWPVGSR
jgi:hypothetical protein